MKILIVDDNASMRRALKSLLADGETEFVECEDGADALAAYTTHQPDFVLMDVAMPKVDGITATAQVIRAVPTARIVIVTSFDAAGLREAAFQAGACSYVLKENLLEVRQWLAAQ
jgi:two-component system response regulator DesR